MSDNKWSIIYIRTLKRISLTRESETMHENYSE